MIKQVANVESCKYRKNKNIEKRLLRQINGQEASEMTMIQKER
jgi:hypothetical protein